MTDTSLPRGPGEERAAKRSPSADPSEEAETAAGLESLLGEDLARDQSRRRRGRLGGLGLLALALAALWFWSHSGGEAAVRYVSEPIVRDDLRILVVASGRLRPTRQVDISSELSGTVRRVRVEENDRVAAGQVLAELDTDKLEASLANARARLRAARSRLKQAEVTRRETRRDRERAEKLAAQEIQTVQQRDAAQAADERAALALASARADADVAAAELRLVQADLEKAEIRAPVDGVVLLRDVDPGQTVAASFQAPVLFSIAEDLAKMEVEVDVDEADVGLVREGQSASFTVDAYPDRRFSAQIRRLGYAPEIVQSVVTYRALLAVDNAEALLRPGLTATAEIEVQRVPDALLAPNAALRFSPPSAPTAPERSALERLLPRPPRAQRSAAEEAGSQQHVLWLLRDGGLTGVSVELGPSDGARTQILSGAVSAGDRVVVDVAPETS